MKLPTILFICTYGKLFTILEIFHLALISTPDHFGLKLVCCVGLLSLHVVLYNCCVVLCFFFNFFSAQICNSISNSCGAHIKFFVVFVIGQYNFIILEAIVYPN